MWESAITFSGWSSLAFEVIDRTALHPQLISAVTENPGGLNAHLYNPRSVSFSISKAGVAFLG